MLWVSSASRALSWLLAVMASIPCQARERLSTCRKAWSSSTISHCSCSDIFRLSSSGCHGLRQIDHHGGSGVAGSGFQVAAQPLDRSEEHTSELQSRPHLVCRLLLEKKN